MFEERAKHPKWSAVLNGLKCRCPRCGKGRLFTKYLETKKYCSVCGEGLSQYNVGLLLPFVIIMIVAHVLVAAMLEIELHGGGSPFIYLIVLIPLAIIVPLILLPFVKGALIGGLWAWNLSDELER